MGERSKIEWCDHTFNPWMGCTKVSEGCKYCYAEAQMDHRWGKVEWGPQGARVRTSPANWRKPLAWNEAAEKAGRPARVFCASLADWLDEKAPIEWLADLLALIQETPRLDWLLLTKRPESFRARLEKALSLPRWAETTYNSLSVAEDWLNGIPPKNVWLGASVENQEQADKRIPELLKIPAQVRFLSCEPLLESVDLGRAWEHYAEHAGYSPDGNFLGELHECPNCTAGENPVDSGYNCPVCEGSCIVTGRSDLARIDWVICGGESGANARPMHPDWARGLRDQCVAASVPFFFKQWGEWLDPVHQEQLSLNEMKAFDRYLPRQDVWFSPGINPVAMQRVQKKNAGRLLDGREWNEFPVARVS